MRILKPRQNVKFINVFFEKMWFVRLFLDIYCWNWLQAKFERIFSSSMKCQFFRYWRVCYSFFLLTLHFVWYVRSTTTTTTTSFSGLCWLCWQNDVAFHFVILSSSPPPFSFGLKSNRQYSIWYFIYIRIVVWHVYVLAITWHIYWLYFLDSSILASTSRCRM